MEKKAYFSAHAACVKLTGGILQRYQEIVRDKAMPYQWKILNDEVDDAEKSGAIENFRIAAGESDGSYYGTCFQDSDVGKWLEGVAYLLCWTKDTQLEERADEIIELLGRAQGTDGYLNTYFTVADPAGRFQNIRECDELYCFGHLAEAAVAYYQATGKRRFLGIICRYADLLCDTFGWEEGKICACDGHPEAELAFVRLYEATGERRYLEQAAFQLETRGSEPYYYDIEWERRGRKSFHPHLQGEKPSDDKEYDQSQCPVRELDRPVGHAVKMCYLLAGMAAYCRYVDDKAMQEACKRIFRRIVTRQMYVTGAVGTTRHKEAFTKDYHLPNDRAYAETCASAAMIFAAQRLLLLEANPEYADAMERVLYNALPAGMALDGIHYFYVNPLEVYPPDIIADHDYDSVKPVRQKWFWCACCPPNLIRLLAGIGGYLYTYNEKELFVNLFADSRTELELSKERRITVCQTTAYPWDGCVKLHFEQVSGIQIGIRIPSWCRAASMTVNGTCRELDTNGKARYELLETEEDVLEVCLNLDMAPYCVMANPEVKADAGKVAVMRGPIVYCLEEVDNGSQLHNVLLNPNALFEVKEDRELGAPVLYTEDGFRQNCGDWREQLYIRYQESIQPAALTFVPYSMWGNRGERDIPQEMQVWTNVWKK